MPAHTGKELLDLAQSGDSAPMVANIRAAQGGDRAALERIRAALELRPEMREVLGSLAHRAEMSLLQGVAAHDALLKSLMQDEIRTLRESLAGPEAAPLEKLLAERVAFAYLNAQHADLCAAAATNQQVTFNTLELHFKRQERAARLLNDAVKTLATVRRLALPAMVNFGQVNVAAGGGVQQVNVTRGKE